MVIISLIARLGGLIAIAAAAAIAACGCNNNAPPQPAATQVSAEAIDKALDAAQQYIIGGQFTNAQAILVKLLEQAPQEPRAHELYGQLLMIFASQFDQQQDTQQAQHRRALAYEHYKTAAGLDQNSPGLQHSAGMIAAAAGHPSDALVYFRRAATLEPANPQHPLFEAQLLVSAQEFDQAQAALEKVLALDPHEPIAHATLAMIALEQSRFEASLQHMAVARQLKPDDPGLRAQEAKIHRRQGQPAKALELLVGLSPADRALPAIAIEIAASYELLGEYIKAAQAWQHVHQLNPDGPEAWLAAVRTAEFLLKVAQHEEARAWLQIAQAAAPEKTEVHALEQAVNGGRRQQ